MPTIQELNTRRAELQQRCYHMGLMNTPSDPEERLKSSAAYRLAYDAWMRAESEYNDALAKMSADDLYALVDGSAESKEPAT